MVGRYNDSDVRRKRLFFGAWIIAFGNGLVEAAANPLIVIFGILFFRERAHGGYKVEQITPAQPTSSP